MQIVANELAAIQIGGDAASSDVGDTGWCLYG